MSIELPQELKLVEPLLHDMGYEWSTHVRLDEDRVWSVINSSTRSAGRVAMSASQAQEYVIDMARSRLSRMKKEQEQIKEILTQVLEGLGRSGPQDPPNPQSKAEKRCQVKAKIQCALLRHFPKMDTVSLAEEIMKEIEE